MEKFINSFLNESSNISLNLDVKKIASMVKIIRECKKKKVEFFF